MCGLTSAGARTLLNASANTRRNSVALAPDVILAGGTLSVAALKHVTRTVAIVFAGVGDPVGAGFVESLARPGGNITGFMVYEYGLGAKWLELLKQLAPNVTRVVCPSRS